jgi:hypothetical protein
MGNPVYLISTKAHGGCDRSAEDAYSSMAPDPTLAFVVGPCCLTLEYIFALWIMITFYMLLTSLFCMIKIARKKYAIPIAQVMHKMTTRRDT